MARWTPPNEARKIEAPPMAEFHRWHTVGDAVLGIVQRFGSNDFGDFVELIPAITIPVRGKPLAVGSIALGLSGNLKPKIPQGLIGRAIGITLSDREARPKGTLNVFTVHELGRAYFADAMAKMGAADLYPHHSALDREIAADEADDDLPF